MRSGGANRAEPAGGLLCLLARAAPTKNDGEAAEQRGLRDS